MGSNTPAPLASPVIASLSISSGQPADPVLITGSAFSATPGEVHFIVANGRDVTAPVSSWTDTQVFAAVPDVSGIPGFNGLVYISRANGNVMACCHDGYLYVPGHALWLGNLDEKSFTDMHREADGNLLYQAFRTIGPKNMLRIAKEHGLNWKPRLYEKHNICDLCRDIMFSRELREGICDILGAGAIQSEIATRRFLRFGEGMPG